MNATCFSAFMNTIFFCRIYRIFLAVAGVCLFQLAVFSQETGAYKTIASGNFQNISIWVVWDGAFWNPAVVKPDQTNDIYIDQTHTLTLTGNEAVKSVFINAQMDAAQKLNLNGNNLDVYGTLQGFEGAAPGTPNRAWNSINWIGNSISSTITFKGPSRTIIPLNSWSAQSDRSRYSVIFDPGPGIILTIEESFKSLSFTIRSGTVYQKLDSSVSPNICPTFSFNTETTIFGPGPFGNFIIETGATFQTDCNSNILFRSASISALNFDLQNGGTLILEGTTPRIETANFQLNGRIIYRGGASAKTYLNSTYADAATPSAVRDLELQGTQNLNLPDQLTLLGDLERSGTGNFITNATTLTLLGGNDQQILGFPLVIRDLVFNKSGGSFFPNANLTIQRNLTLVQGSMNLTGYDLLINTGLAGALNFSGGSWRNIGQLTYFGIPTNLTGTNSTFPFEDTRNGGIRKVQLFGTSVGGNLSINFTEYQGAEYNSGFFDYDGIEILYRLFSYFQFSDLSLSSNPVELRISADDLIVDNVDDLRIVGTGYAAPGTHLPGLDPIELWARRALTFDDLMGVNFTVGSYRTLSILPVTWLELTSESTSEGNLVKWTVAQEKDNLFFEIHRSYNPADGNWEKVGVVSSLGDSDLERAYQFLDKTRKPFVNHFYRIRQVDFSGRSTWSNVTKVAYPKENRNNGQLILFPNPYSSGDLDLILPETIDTAEAELMIFDAQGKVIIGPITFDQTIAPHLSNLAPGIYLIRIISNQKVFMERLIRK